jgi:UDP-glucose 4-epimerase
VFGKNGLIGRSIVESLSRLGHLVYENSSINWSNRDVAPDQIRDSVYGFFDSTSSEEWMIFWFAGKGGFSVSQEQLDFDQIMFDCLLESVEKYIKQPGLVVLASSAGALYSSDSDMPFDETSFVKPNSSYGRLKMIQELALASFSSRTGCPSLITRISTVYGSGGDFRNGYGLINHLCRSDVRRFPVEIFVPMETSRNYIYSEDAGELVVRFALSCFSDSRMLNIRNVVAPSSVSIAEIVSICSKIFKRKVVFSNRIDSRQVSYNIRFDVKTLYLSDVQQICWTPISVGISEVHQYLMFELQSAGLADPFD